MRGWVVDTFIDGTWSSERVEAMYMDITAGALEFRVDTNNVKIAFAPGSWQRVERVTWD